MSDFSLKLIDRFLEFSLSSCLCPSLPLCSWVPLTGILLQFFSCFPQKMLTFCPGFSISDTLPLVISLNSRRSGVKLTYIRIWFLEIVVNAGRNECSAPGPFFNKRKEKRLIKQLLSWSRVPEFLLTDLGTYIKERQFFFNAFRVPNNQFSANTWHKIGA